jgi:hypothetical protein
MGFAQISSFPQWAMAGQAFLYDKNVPQISGSKKNANHHRKEVPVGLLDPNPV